MHGVGRLSPIVFVQGRKGSTLKVGLCLGWLVQGRVCMVLRQTCHIQGRWRGIECVPVQIAGVAGPGE